MLGEWVDKKWLYLGLQVEEECLIGGIGAGELD